MGGGAGAGSLSSQSDAGEGLRGGGAGAGADSSHDSLSDTDPPTAWPVGGTTGAGGGMLSAAGTIVLSHES